MRTLAIKTLALLTLFAMLNLAVRQGVRRWLAGRLDPRTELLRQGPSSSTRLAILGDSVFCSRYVDREQDSLWSQLARMTGLPVFPGALDGGRGGDLLAAARILSERLPVGSRVFVDIHPVAAWRRAEVSYGAELFRGWGYVLSEPTPLQRLWNRAGRPLFAAPIQWRDLMLTLRGWSRASFFGRPPTHDRIWSQDTDFPRARYLAFERTFTDGGIARPPDPEVVDELHEILAQRGIELVFVLTPLNRAMIAAWSTPAAGAAIREALVARHAANLELLRSRGYDFIDLYQAVPPEGFADFLHTNAEGDAILARAMADHLARAGPAGADQGGAPPTR
jgi:hypothetical protein